MHTSFDFRLQKKILINRSLVDISFPLVSRQVGEKNKASEIKKQKNLLVPFST
jgi:hypothetical protein